MSTAGQTVARQITVPRVSIGGSPMATEWADRMVGVSLELALQAPARLSLRFVTPPPDSGLELPFHLGTKVSISFPDTGESSSMVELASELLVTEVALEREHGGNPDVIVVAEDRSVLLAHSQRVATYLNMSASDVVSKLLDGTGLTAEVESTSEVYPYLMQADSDIAFLTALARRTGYDWWVEGKTLHFAKPPANPPTVQVAVHTSVLRLSVRASSVPSQQVKVTGWDRANKGVVAGTATPPSRRTLELDGADGSALDALRSKPFMTAQYLPATKQEADQLAAAIANRHTAAATVADGEMYGDPAVVPRSLLELSDHRISGTFEITRCEHRFDHDGYTTRFVAGDREPSGLVDVLAGGASGSGHGSFGLTPTMVPAVVTAIGTGENLGRVKVKLPYMSEADESHWARVLAAGGGPERGFWFLPEVDDEVLVGFEGGDVRFPVVMGGLYGKVQTPEAQLVKDGKIAARSVRSRLGHYLELQDGDGPESRHVLFGLGKDGKAGDEYKMRLGEDRFDLEVPKGKPVSIKSGDNQITITDKGLVHVLGQQVTVEAKEALSLKGKSVTIEGTQDVSIKGSNSSIGLAAGGAEVKGAPGTTIKGSPTVAIG